MNAGRYPFAPVEAYIRATNITDTTDEHWLARNGLTPTVNHIARICGVGRTEIHRWRSDGLTWIVADRLATRLGHYPTAFWPTWEQDALAVASDIVHGTMHGYRTEVKHYGEACFLCKLARRRHQRQGAAA